MLKNLQRQLLNILEDENSKIMGINGRKLVKDKYTWSGIAEKTEKLYNKLI